MKKTFSTQAIVKIVNSVHAYLLDSEVGSVIAGRAADMIMDAWDVAEEVPDDSKSKNCIHQWQITNIDYSIQDMNYVRFERRCKTCSEVQIANGFDIGWHDIGDFIG